MQNPEYIIHADDSSDDEEVGSFYANQPKFSKRRKAKGDILTDIFCGKKNQPSMTPQMIEEQANKFKTDEDRYFGYVQDDNWTWYFIIYDLGVRLLYHNDVEIVYQTKKREFIGKSYFTTENKTPDEVSTVIQSCKQSVTPIVSNRSLALVLADRASWLSNVINPDNAAKIKNILNTNKISLIRANLHFEHIFISNNIIEYLANIRLCNRSVKRYIAQKRQSSNRDLIQIERTWQLLPNQAQCKESQTCQYNKETQKYSRSDIARGLGKYNAEKATSIREQIKNILINCKLSDKELALYIRNTLKHEQIPNNAFNKNLLDTFLVRITHLLFGVESARSPEAFIIHNMLLDLIIELSPTNYQWRWENVIQSEMVAAFEEEILITMRKAYNDLHPYLTYPYYHPGPMRDYVEGRKEFDHLYEHILKKYIDKQTYIVVVWASLKLRNDVTTPSLIKKILEEHTHWFSIIFPNLNVQQGTESSQAKLIK